MNVKLVMKQVQTETILDQTSRSLMIMDYLNNHILKAVNYKLQIEQLIICKLWTQKLQFAISFLSVYDGVLADET